MSRLETRFKDLKAAGRKALIPYICAGDPHPEMTVPIMHALVKGGADAIELGMPFSDPMADGKTIQHASERALAQGMTLAKVLDDVAEFRKTDKVTPIVLMGYANPIERCGLDKFVERASEVDVDGVLIVDYPPQESLVLREKLKAKGIDIIYLLAPTSTDKRIGEVAEQASGYIYYVSLKGVTGTKDVDTSAVSARLPLIRSQSELPICVGFGIKDGKSAQQLAQVADGVIIGSKLILELQAAGDKAVERAQEWIAEIRCAIDTPIS